MIPALCHGFSSEDNEKGHIPQVAFENQERIEICLADIQLTHLPPTINLFKFLKVCHLTKNQLRTLPDEFFDLQCLESLDASVNYFRIISNKINRLTRLININFSHNEIVELPAELCLLTNLRTITFNQNRLRYLPDEIGQLVKLKEFYLAHNLLSCLPPGIGRLSSLENLHLKANLLTTLPREIGLLQQLITLSLTQNRLRQLPVEIGYLKNLNKLFVKQNPYLLELPYTMLQWRRTTKVRFDLLRLNNRLYTELPCSFPSLVQLAAARVFPMLRQINPQVLPRDLLIYLYDSNNRYICKTCVRMGRLTEVHFGEPAKIVRRWSKWFGGRRWILPFGFEYCLPCFRQQTQAAI